MVCVCLFTGTLKNFWSLAAGTLQTVALAQNREYLHIRNYTAQRKSVYNQHNESHRNIKRNTFTSLISTCLFGVLFYGILKQTYEEHGSYTVKKMHGLDILTAIFILVLIVVAFITGQIASGQKFDYLDTEYNEEYKKEQIYTNIDENDTLLLPDDFRDNEDLYKNEQTAMNKVKQELKVASWLHVPSFLAAGAWVAYKTMRGG